MQALELKIPPLLLFIVTAAAMALPDLIEGTLWQWSPFTGVGLSLGAMALLLIIASVLTFRRASTTVNPMNPELARSIVDHGVFAVSRNPMYLAMTVGLFGEVLVLAQIFALPVPVLFALYLHRFQVLPEERLLAQRFGLEYQGYLRRVRRWL